MKQEIVMFYADKNFLYEIDKKSNERKRAILSSKTDIIPVGRSFYVSNEGDDKNDGRTPENAVATLAALDRIGLLPGDVVFLRRGDMWRICGWTVPAGVTLSAYGEGAKPVVTCSPENAARESKWTLVNGTDNIWLYADKINDCGCIEFDDGIFAVKATPWYVDGRYVHDDCTTEFDPKTDLPCDLAFFQNCDSVKTDDGLPKLYTTENLGSFYLRCDKGNPGAVFASIEFFAGRNALRVGGPTVTVDNICIKHCAAHGVGAGNAFELHVQNCEIGPLGGGIQFYNKNGSPVRYGNGVEIYGGCRDYVVKDCYIHDIYDAGVTHQRKGSAATLDYRAESAYPHNGEVKTFDMKGVIVMEDIVYSGNLFERCIYSIEYFCDQSDSDLDCMRNVLMENNICRFAGGWGWQRPNKVARHIQGGWLGSKRKYPSENYVVRNNIFDRSIDVLVSISSTKKEDLPKMENNLYIQYEGGNYGMYGVPYDRYYAFDSETEKTVVNGLQSENVKLYAVQRENI